MTFKHEKFEDSATMRSLAKVAKERGWLPETITKTASAEHDYSPTENLTENIIKLCSGLRNLGFEKYADELEDKFVSYKKANSMYETSKEKGEDLVDAAHPEGSHKLVGVEGDGLVETILDQQLEDIKMVNKTPNGKLSSAQILNKVKIVLGQNVHDPKVQAGMRSLVSALSSIAALYHNESWLSRPTSFLDVDVDDVLEFARSVAMNPSLDDINKIYVDAGRLRDLYEPKMVGAAVSTAAWQKMKPMFDKVWGSVKQVSDALENPQTEAAKPAEMVAPEIQNVLKLYNDASTTVKRYTAMINAKDPDNKENLLQWLKGMNDFLDKELKLFNESDNASKLDTAKIYSDKVLEGVVPRLNAFRDKYVNI